MPFKKTIRLRKNRDNIQPIIHTALVFIFSVFSVGCPFPLLFKYRLERGKVFE